MAGSTAVTTEEREPLVFGDGLTFLVQFNAVLKAPAPFQLSVWFPLPLRSVHSALGIIKSIRLHLSIAVPHALAACILAMGVFVQMMQGLTV